MIGPGVRSSSRDEAKVESDSLPDLETLRSSRDFQRVLKEGIRYRSGGVVVVRSPGIPGPPRYGLVVSRGSGGAVTRNRIKRRLRHSVRALQLHPGYDYVITATSQVAEVPHDRLMGWLRHAIAELGDD